MKFVVFFVAVYFACAAAFQENEWDESMYEQIRTGKRAEAIDDAQSTVVCGKHYWMKSCECVDPDTCDGSWIRSTTDGDECVVWTRAAGTPDGRVIGAVPRATCIRLRITVETDMMANPSVGCPDNYARVGCNFHNYYQHHAPETLGVTQRNGMCDTFGDCQKCRVQAVCLRNTNV